MIKDPSLMLTGELSFLWSSVFEDFMEHRSSSCLRLFKVLWLQGRAVDGDGAFVAIIALIFHQVCYIQQVEKDSNWDSFGKMNLRASSVWLFYLQVDVSVMKVLVTQSCPTLCYPRDCSPPGSSVHGILQARILGWIALSFSRGSSWHRDWAGAPQVPPQTEELDRLQSMGRKESVGTERLTLSLWGICVYVSLQEQNSPRWVTVMKAVRIK